MPKKISIVNCVSEAHEMLEFSSDQIVLNAGIDEFNYIIVCWRTTPEVDKTIDRIKKRFLISKPKINIIRLDYKGEKDLAYVPHLREMMNTGFRKGLELADFVGLTNTDQCFAQDWLLNLEKYAEEDIVVTSTLFEAGPTRHFFFPCGLPTYEQFDVANFNVAANQVRRNGFIDESQKNFMDLQSLPYLFSRKVWEQCGPWELTLENGTPDVNFFTRVHNAGFKFKKSQDSIAYHYGGAERGATKEYKKPKFSEEMKYE